MVAFPGTKEDNKQLALLYGSIKRKEAVFKYIVDDEGLNFQAFDLEIRYKWSAFLNYRESECFFVLAGKKEELTNDIWLNKAYIDTEDMEILRSNLLKIFK